MAEMKALARRIFQETLLAIDIPVAMQRKLRRTGSVLHCGGVEVDLHAFSGVRVVAMGKAAHGMVEGLVQLLPAGTESTGVVSSPTAPMRAMRGMNYFLAGHPIPNAESWASAKAILELLKECDEHTVVFFLLSGGGSALVELPLDERQTLADMQEVHRALVTCGAPIDAMNMVRKHLSAVKGGRMAAAAPAARKITLGVSDVPAGKETALSSGPTLPDPTTVADAMRVIKKYSLLERFPAALKEWLEAGKMTETPKEGDAAFANAYFELVLGMDELFHPAHHAAEAMGFESCCDNTTDDWPVEKAAENLLGQLEELRRASPGRRVALIADGEVSSPVTGNGIGGRNAAFVLACVEKIAGQDVAVLSVGTDGIDGNSPAAGAVADGETWQRGKDAGLMADTAFRNSDAYSYFARLGDAVVTGPTGNNLRDLRILLAGKKK
ncbi:MAG: glycerate kinase [Candidatus Acidiferrum sp.]